MRKLPFDVAGSQQLVKRTGDFIDHHSTFRRLTCKQAYLLPNRCADFVVREPWEIIEVERDGMGFLNLKLNGNSLSLGRKELVDRKKNPECGEPVRGSLNLFRADNIADLEPAGG